MLEHLMISADDCHFVYIINDLQWAHIAYIDHVWRLVLYILGSDVISCYD